MTREEAIKIAKGLRYDFKCDSELMVNFCNIVLDALQTEPCEDAVKREAVLNTLDAIDAALDEKRTVEAYKDLLKECYKELPPVQPKTKTGHWIVQPSNKEQGERDFIWWKCSECGQVIFSETEHDRLEFHAFCGRCGADMREVKE